MKTLISLLIIALAINSVYSTATITLTLDQNAAAGFEDTNDGGGTGTTTTVNLNGANACSSVNLDTIADLVFAANSGVTTLNIDLSSCTSFAAVAAAAFDGITTAGTLEALSITLKAGMTPAEVDLYLPATNGFSSFTGLQTVAIDAKAIFDVATSIASADVDSYLTALFRNQPAALATSLAVDLRNDGTNKAFFLFSQSQIEAMKPAAQLTNASTTVKVYQSDLENVTVASGGLVQAFTKTGGAGDINDAFIVDVAGATAAVAGQRYCDEIEIVVGGTNVISAFTGRAGLTLAITGVSVTGGNAYTATADFVGGAIPQTGNISLVRNKLTAADAAAVFNVHYQVVEGGTASGDIADNLATASAAAIGECCHATASQSSDNDGTCDCDTTAGFNAGDNVGATTACTCNATAGFVANGNNCECNLEMGLETDGSNGCQCKSPLTDPNSNLQCSCPTSGEVWDGTSACGAAATCNDYVLDGNFCVAACAATKLNDDAATPKTCTSCESNKEANVGRTACVCPSGLTKWDGTNCVVSCPTGDDKYEENNECKSCASGETWNSTASACESGSNTSASTLAINAIVLAVLALLI